MPRNEFQAILETLAESVKSGLNASLSPKDCKMLLAYIFSPPGTPRPVDRIIDKLTTVVENVLDDLEPKKKRRKS